MPQLTFRATKDADPNMKASIIGVDAFEKMHKVGSLLRFHVKRIVAMR
jgi:hypothetical protein